MLCTGKPGSMANCVRIYRADVTLFYCLGWCHRYCAFYLEQQVERRRCQHVEGLPFPDYIQAHLQAEDTVKATLCLLVSLPPKSKCALHQKAECKMDTVTFSVPKGECVLTLRSEDEGNPI